MRWTYYGTEHVTPLWNNVVQPIPGTTIRLVSGRALNIYRAKYVSDFHANYFAFRATCTTLASPVFHSSLLLAASSAAGKRELEWLDKFKLNFRCSPPCEKNHPIFMFKWPFFLFLLTWFVWRNSFVNSFFSVPFCFRDFEKKTSEW